MVLLMEKLVCVKCECCLSGEGLRKNVEIVKKWREKIGPDFPLSIDCYMSLVCI